MEAGKLLTATKFQPNTELKATKALAISAAVSMETNVELLRYNTAFKLNTLTSTHLSLRPYDLGLVVSG